MRCSHHATADGTPPNAIANTANRKRRARARLRGRRRGLCDVVFSCGSDLARAGLGRVYNGINSIGREIITGRFRYCKPISRCGAKSVEKPLRGRNPYTICPLDSSKRGSSECIIVCGTVKASHRAVSWLSEADDTRRTQAAGQYTAGPNHLRL
jgi:hypothetical protein